MTRVLVVVAPIIGLAVIAVIVYLFGDRLNGSSGDPYDWQ